MSNFISLHQESLYLQGARDLLLRLSDMGAIPQFHTERYTRTDNPIYNKCVFGEILYNRESLVKFLQGSGWRYSDHKRDKKGKLTKVKVKFE